VPYFLKAPPKGDAGEEVLNARGERLFQVLTQDKKFTLEEMTDLGFDTYVIPADVIVPLLERAARNAENPEMVSAMKRITAWDRRSAVNSVAYTYIHFWGEAYRNLYARQFRRFLNYARRDIDIESPEEQTMALEAMKLALEDIQKQFGKTEVPWGEINVALRGGTFPMDGEALYDVLHRDEGRRQPNGQIHCDDGWGHLLIVMEGEPKQVWSLLPYGQSEHPESPHYNDQTILHSKRRVKRFWLTPAEILAHAESVRGNRDRIKQLMKEKP
jgi:acyl-homoserine lactone acylase PvdQ